MSFYICASINDAIICSDNRLSPVRNKLEGTFNQNWNILIQEYAAILFGLDELTEQKPHLRQPNNTGEDNNFGYNTNSIENAFRCSLRSEYLNTYKRVHLPLHSFCVMCKNSLRSFMSDSETNYPSILTHHDTEKPQVKRAFVTQYC